jgi:23S rRNA (uracil1939-C5)-methyltransferase
MVKSSIDDNMNKPQIGQIISLPIHGLGSSGEGVGYFDGFTVFVDGALPQEMVEAQMVHSQKRYGSARLLSVVQPSQDRILPPCKLFGRCGGCQLMHLSYNKQLEVKRQRVVEALARIGKIFDAPVLPCIASPSTLSYRNKIQLPTRKGERGMEMGLYARGSHDLVEVSHCPIHCSLGDQIYQTLTTLLRRFPIEPYDVMTGEGELRHLLIKTAVHTKEVLVIFVTNQKVSPLIAQIAQAVMLECAPHVKGVVHNLHQERDNVILGSVYEVLEGSGTIREHLCGLDFKISPASFFQVNPYQAAFLYLKALEYAELRGDETVLDAYCGVGTLSLIFARSAKKVIGVEWVAEAIEDALENRSLNQIDNVDFICASSESFIRSLSSVDVVLLNPPRKGCEPSFLEGIGRLLPKKLIYISCDPATLARDLAHLVSLGYRVKEVQPFDMFPQTAHVESVVILCPDSLHKASHEIAPLSSD